MLKILAKNPNYKGLQIRFGHELKTIGEGITVEEIPDETKPIIETLFRMGAIEVIKIQRDESSYTEQKPSMEPERMQGMKKNKNSNQGGNE